MKDKKPMADWSDLPIDVLEHLTSFLPLPDYHRFSAVCQNWLIATKQRRHSPAKQLPWQLVRGDNDPHKHRVFSICENHHYNIDFPELQGQYVCGSSYGWLFTVDIDLNIKLLNPLMGKCYDLPLHPFSDIIKGYIRESIGHPGRMTVEYAQIMFVYKAILDHDPAQRSDFTVLILTGSIERSISFWRPGTMVWTLVDDDANSFDGITYSKGKFYAYEGNIDTEGDYTHVTYVVDMVQDPKVTRVAPEVPLYHRYENSLTHLVDFQGELLLLQRWIPKLNNYSRPKWAILVYKLDLEEGKYYPRDHLDGYSIFLGNSSPLVIDPGLFPGCKENSIYFAPHSSIFSRVDSGIYDMLKGTVLPFYPPANGDHSHNLNPIWWSPNPW